MTTNERDGATVRIPPPLVYVAGMFAGALLNSFVIRLPISLPTGARIAVTSVCALAGVGLLAGAAGLFRRTDQDPKPWKSTPEIISSGVYGFSRNPMYVSMALIQASLGFGLASAWIVVMVAPVLFLIYLTAVRHEEAYLERKFGKTYLDYKASVRRWL